MSISTPSQAVVVPQREGLKETLESIVVALILAFVFRAFIVEAFVIPTGSMAPTLYGAHGTVMCADCGVEFAYGVRDLAANPRSAGSVRNGSRAVCPNCHHANTNLRITDAERNRERGDRILVLKWPFDIGGDRLGPRRWDVVVFKDPSDGVTNFIKRQVGLPGEVLMIIDGDVYTVPSDALSVEALAELESVRHEKYERRVGLRDDGRSLRPVPPAVLAELDQKVTIARKTEAAQEALWFTVYDHDYPPLTPGPNQPRWSPGQAGNSGWDASNRKVEFSDRGTVDDYIELKGKSIRATCAYNIGRRQGGEPVSDLRARFVLTPQDRHGVLHVRLEKNKRVFWGTIHMDGRVALHESSGPPSEDMSAMASRTLTPFKPGRAVAISFENLDYRLTMRVDGDIVLVSSDEPESPAYYVPDVKALRRFRHPSSAPRFYGAGGPFELSHLVIDRDEYYYHNPAFRALPTLRWAPHSGWGSAESPILLRDDEFFMLGDNTSASKDSRLWDVVGPHLTRRGEDFQLGTVPRDQLIGKAFFVYWPSGHPIGWLPKIGTWNWPLIPDVGRMRWIR